MQQIKCNKCGYVGNEDEFPTGRDFFQKVFIKHCPVEGCTNRQSPGDASLRMMPGQVHPFEYVRPEALSDDPFVQVLHNAAEAS